MCQARHVAFAPNWAQTRGKHGTLSVVHAQGNLLPSLSSLGALDDSHKALREASRGGTDRAERVMLDRAEYIATGPLDHLEE